jgi:hypothetical protein
MNEIRIASFRVTRVKAGIANDNKKQRLEIA